MALAPAMSNTQRTFCRICEAHCGLLVESDAKGALVRIRPDREHPISQGFVCPKGTQFLDVADHPDRVLQPRLRMPDGIFADCSWKRALEQIGSRIHTILEEHGPDSVALYLGTPAVHNALGAMAYFAFARAIGTRNLYSAGSQDNDSKIVAARMVHGNEWIQPIMDLEHADFALLLGTNPAISRGTYFQLQGINRAFDRFRARGGRCVFVDPRRTESAQRWGEHLPIRPGTDVYLLLALLHELRDLYRPNGAVVGMDELLQLASEYPAHCASQLTDVPEQTILQLAALLHSSARATFFLSVGVNQGPFGTLSSIALQALAYLTGNFDSRGGILFQPYSALLAPLLSFKHQRSRIGDYLANAGGLPAGILADEILTEGPDRIRALIVFAGNPVTSAPDENRMRSAFQKLDLLVSLDMFENETASEAHFILPATSWLERFDIGAWNAAFAQARFLDASPAIRDPVGSARPEWKIFADLSIAAGRPMLGALTNAVSRLPLDRLMRVVTAVAAFPFRRYMRWSHGVPWREPRPGSYLRKGRVVSFWSDDLRPERGRLADYAARVQAAQMEDSSFYLLSRRRHRGQNSWIHGSDDDSVAWLAPADLKKLGIASGHRILVTSDAGKIQIAAVPQDGVMPGTIVIPHGLPNINVNRLISSDHALIEPLSGMHRMTANRVRVQAMPLT